MVMIADCFTFLAPCDGGEGCWAPAGTADQTVRPSVASATVTATASPLTGIPPHGAARRNRRPAPLTWPALFTATRAAIDGHTTHVARALLETAVGRCDGGRAWPTAIMPRARGQ